MAQDSGIPKWITGMGLELMANAYAGSNPASAMASCLKWRGNRLKTDGEFPHAGSSPALAKCRGVAE